MNCIFSLQSAVICVYLGRVLVHIVADSINGIDVEVVSTEKYLGVVVVNDASSGRIIYS